MDEINDLFQQLVSQISILEIVIKGMIIGIVASAPMGPVGVLCVQRTLNKGRAYGFVTGTGAALSDILYALLTGYGLSFLYEIISNQTTLFWIQIIGAIIMFLFGLHTFRTNPMKNTRNVSRNKSSLLQNGITGFFITLSNPTIILLFLGLFTPFYKALADKWGRKPLFAISTAGMALGLLIIHLSSSYIMFLVGFAVISFFMGHDIQIIYILEEAPDKHRAKIYSLLKSFGILGVILIPTLRDALMGDDATKWRDIFLVPALIGFAATLLVVLFAKDTKVFINERTEYLSRPYEDRQREKELKKQQKQAQRNQAGVFNGVKYIFANKDTKMLIISHIIFDSAMPAIALYFESSMHRAGMSTSDITKALFMVPVIYAAITFLSGFIAIMISYLTL